jgi:hypothetical protein
MNYQVSYGPTYTGYATANTYVEADSYAEALMLAFRYAHPSEKVQWVHVCQETDVEELDEV